MASAERAIALFRTMARIRAFENAAEEASRGSVAAFGASLAQSNIRGPLHLSTGQEAVAAGVCINLEKNDYVTSTHRGHGHTLAKGAAMDAMLRPNGVVADGMQNSEGAAHAIKIRNEKRVVACFSGDGAINRGPYLEALNWAAIHALPVLFVCEDNRWSATTATDAMTAGEGALARAEAIGVPGVHVDGNDVLAVDAQARKLLMEVRSGKGPRFLHAVTNRFKATVPVDAAANGAGAEATGALENDPLVAAEKALIAKPRPEYARKPKRRSGVP